MKVLIVNGPNLNMLGIREKQLYGNRTYDDLLKCIDKWAGELDIRADVFQSNHEGAIVDRIQQAYGAYDGIIINPAAYTHTSIAILDALKAVEIPCCEVHLTDISGREPFRQISYAGMACEQHFTGMGFEGYHEALRWFAGEK
ncbi:MAG: type II 3-dehydroquinate dehydratase [Clostridiales bacterium]|nr:type II 3-dehydroquinate dehydratase [Clostridiales bacterium]